jgi:hypothetical protein
MATEMSPPANVSLACTSSYLPWAVYFVAVAVQISTVASSDTGGALLVLPTAVRALVRVLCNSSPDKQIDLRC